MRTIFSALIVSAIEQKNPQSFFRVNFNAAQLVILRWPLFLGRRANGTALSHGRGLVYKKESASVKAQDCRHCTDKSMM
jgi:hypothetical protein